MVAVPMAATVRRGRNEDAARIVEMVKTLSTHEGRGACKLTVADLEAHCFTERPLFFILVAESEGRLVGYSLFYVTFDTELAAPGLWMADLYVETDMRRQGIATMLLAALVEECRARRGRWIAWQVMRTNDAAIGFYDAVAARDEDLSYWTEIAEIERRIGRAFDNERSAGNSR